MADVAARAGVAIGTVSNVLNRPEKVREATRRKVDAAIAELGFVRNDTARSLAAGTSRAIGLVVADLGNSLFVDIARGAERVMRRQSFDVVIVNSDIDTERERHNVELMDRARVAGVLLAPLDTPNARSGNLPSRTTPTVLVNYTSADPAFSASVVDERMGGALATRHVIAQGRTRLLFAGGPLFLTAIRERRDGAMSAAAEVSGVSLGLAETDGLKIAQGRALGEELVALGPGRFDGIIAASDLLAIGLIQAFRDVPGFQVPDDIAITGYDDNHLSAESDIPITTVSQQGEKLGEAAAELLLRQLADPSVTPETTVLPPVLIPRASTIGHTPHALRPT